MSTNPARTADHAITQLFLERASTRAFANDAIPDDVLFASFEAARWAPSATNAQPWRFVYARRGSEHWPAWQTVLNERNQLWAGKAAALVAVLSRTVRDSDGGVAPSRSHAFDAGAAWSNFAHQAHLLGWKTRAIGGFDPDKARTLLGVPDDYAINAFVAIGKAGDAQSLHESLRGLEQPTQRRPLRELVAEGRFTFA